MKKWLLFVLELLPMLLCIGMIFMFSSEVSTESSARSGQTCIYFVDIANELFHLDLKEEERYEIAALIEYPVRKLAHMTEYALLALSIWFFVVFRTAKNPIRYGTVVLIGLIVATLDEFYQTTVPGRSGQIADVLVDETGVLLMALVIFVIIRKI